MSHRPNPKKNKSDRRKRPADLKRICLIWMSAGKVDHEFAERTISLAMEPGEGWDIQAQMTLRTGGLLGAARNELVDGVLTNISPECEWVLMLDTDVVMQREDLDKLAALANLEERPVVTGVYLLGFLGRKPLEPCVYDLEWLMDGKYPSFRPYYDVLSRTEPFQVKGAGAGCLLVHRRVFEAMAQPHPNGFGTTHRGARNAYIWFQDGAQFEGKYIGEDLAWFIKLDRMQIPVWCHPQVWVGHKKDVILTRELYELQAIGAFDHLAGKLVLDDNGGHGDQGDDQASGGQDPSQSDEAEWLADNERDPAHGGFSAGWSGGGKPDPDRLRVVPRLE